jgi:hypothetical protein
MQLPVCPPLAHSWSAMAPRSTCHSCMGVGVCRCVMLSARHVHVHSHHWMAAPPLCPLQLTQSPTTCTPQHAANSSCQWFCTVLLQSCMAQSCCCTAGTVRHSWWGLQAPEAIGSCPVAAQLHSMHTLMHRVWLPSPCGLATSPLPRNPVLPLRWEC